MYIIPVCKTVNVLDEWWGRLGYGRKDLDIFSDWDNILASTLLYKVSLQLGPVLVECDGGDSVFGLLRLSGVSGSDGGIGGEGDCELPEVGGIYLTHGDDICPII